MVFLPPANPTLERIIYNMNYAETYFPQPGGMEKGYTHLNKAYLLMRNNPEFNQSRLFKKACEMLSRYWQGSAKLGNALYYSKQAEAIKLIDPSSSIEEGSALDALASLSQSAAAPAIASSSSSSEMPRTSKKRKSESSSSDEERESGKNSFDDSLKLAIGHVNRQLSPAQTFQELDQLEKAGRFTPAQKERIVSWRAALQQREAPKQAMESASSSSSPSPVKKQRQESPSSDEGMAASASSLSVEERHFQKKLDRIKTVFTPGQQLYQLDHLEKNRGFLTPAQREQMDALRAQALAEQNRLNYERFKISDPEFKSVLKSILARRGSDQRLDDLKKLENYYVLTDAQKQEIQSLVEQEEPFASAASSSSADEKPVHTVANAFVIGPLSNEDKRVMALVPVHVLRFKDEKLPKEVRIQELDQAIASVESIRSSDAFLTQALEKLVRDLKKMKGPTLQ